MNPPNPPLSIEPAKHIPKNTSANYPWAKDKAHNLK